MSNPRSEGFLSLKKRRIREVFQNIGDYISGIFDVHDDYIQMRLPVEKITKEFEDSLKNKIEHKFIHAEIREATKNDIKSIKNMYDQAWPSSPMPFRPMQQEKLFKIFKDTKTVFLIAKVDSTDGGFILLDLEGGTEKIGIIGGLGILPEFQHQGLGTILGLTAWNYFKEKGVKELRCEVHLKNKISLAFIKGLGFEEYFKDDYYPQRYK